MQGEQDVVRDRFETRSSTQRVRDGEWLVGTVISSPDLLLAERVARAFDFVWIDLEHSALTVRDAQSLAIAVRAGGAATLVRLPNPASDLIGAILDAGVEGVVAPKVESVADATNLVRAMRYPPRGTRGFAPRRATGGQGSWDAEREDPLCVVQIETQLGLANVDQIAAVDGIDALVVGTADLSLDLGIPLQMEAAELEHGVEAVARVASGSGKAWGVAIGRLPGWTKTLRARGGSILVLASDIRIYSDAIEQAAQDAQMLGLGREARGRARR